MRCLPDSLEQEGRSLGSRPRYSAKGSARGFAVAVRLKARMAARLVRESFMVLMWIEDEYGEFRVLGLCFGLVGRWWEK